MDSKHFTYTQLLEFEESKQKQLWCITFGYTINNMHKTDVRTSFLYYNHSSHITYRCNTHMKFSYFNLIRFSNGQLCKQKELFGDSAWTMEIAAFNNKCIDNFICLKNNLRMIFICLSMINHINYLLSNWVW